MRASIFHLAVTGLFAWGFAAAGVCEAHCAQAAADLASAAHGAEAADRADGCGHGSPPERVPRGHDEAPCCAGGALSPWCSAVSGVSLQASPSAARPGGPSPLLVAAPAPAPTILAAASGRSIPPDTAPRTAARRQHRNPPLRI